MSAILLTTAVFGVIYLFLHMYILSPSIGKLDNKRKNPHYLLPTMLISSAVYIVCSLKYPGHKTDINCFNAWSTMIFDGGIANFYTSEAFHDYPPGYMYILYFIGALRKLLPTSSVPLVLLKLPSLICNLFSGALIYRITCKKLSKKTGAILSALYLLNPAVITNGALWGQVDAVYTAAILAMVYLISEKKMIASYFVFALCIFIKPQALIFTPVLIFGIIENFFLDNFDLKTVMKNFALGICAILMIVLLSLPFGFGNVIEQYIKTVSEQYPYLTVNAFNLWGALGKNWTPLSTFTSALGYLFIAAITLYSAYVFFKSKSSSKYYFIGAFLSFMTYMLSVKMHDRYAFPAIVLLLAAFSEDKSSRNYFLYCIVTLSQFFNTAWVLFIYEQDINKYFQSPVIIAASVINIIFMLYMIWCAYKNYSKNEVMILTKAQKNIEASDKAAKTFSVQTSKILSKITRFDIIAIVVLMIIYGGIAIYNLGDRESPETETIISKSPVTIDLGADYDISKLKFFLGSYNLDMTRDLKIDYIDSEHNTLKTDTLSSNAVFYWSEIQVDCKARYITLTAPTQDIRIKEFTVMHGDEYLQPVNAESSEISALFDEQRLVPERSSFKNSTYFDEIYHARTAYEFIHHLDIYEWTHPPLGKLFISLGIIIFGMCPFGWRIIGTIFGILMIPAIYIFAKRLFKHSHIALVTCILFTFDFMHFAQTRISTIDVYVTFFIILMYYYMFKYFCMSFYDTSLKKTFLPLALSGVCMGFGIACKWTGMYAGAGLAVIFFGSLYKRYREYLYALKTPNSETNGIKHRHIIETFKPNTIKTILWCCIFFVAVPALIYALSYIPYMLTPNGNGIKTIFENASSMYTYHADTVLGSKHPYSSRWFQWPIMYRPIWYYSGTVSDNLKEGISAFGNPAVWWAGIPAFIYTLYNAVRKSDKRAAFLAIAYLAQFIPWIPISRLTFIYHYFPCVPFAALMIGYAIYTFYEEAQLTSSGKKVIYGAYIYAFAAVLLFAMFYPVLSGYPCTPAYANTWLKWFDSWVLLAN